MITQFKIFEIVQNKKGEYFAFFAFDQEDYDEICDIEKQLIRLNLNFKCYVNESKNENFFVDYMTKKDKLIFGTGVWLSKKIIKNDILIIIIGSKKDILSMPMRLFDKFDWHKLDLSKAIEISSPTDYLEYKKYNL